LVSPAFTSSLLFQKKTDKEKAGETKTKWAAADGGRRAGIPDGSLMRIKWALSSTWNLEPGTWDL
jgi:hypothetical protein